MFTVAALYKFTRFEDPDAMAAPLREICVGADVTGTLLLAREGINGTIAGPAVGVARVLEYLRTLPGLADLDWKESSSEKRPFRRMKVRVKREIVTMREDVADPTVAVGRYVSAEDWNAVIASDDVAVIDTRNDYEIAIGTFDGAINPRTDAFSEFPAWWRRNKARFDGKRIAMFCTGGIRCEKATSFLLQEGVRDVVHLDGGILKYLETVPEAESRWTGHCFVFDGRVSVGHGLEEGPHVLCHGCRMPLTDDDIAHRDYEEGVSCPKCHPVRSDADRARFRERQRQMERAKLR